MVIGTNLEELSVRELRDILSECLENGIDGKVAVIDDNSIHNIYGTAYTGQDEEFISVTGDSGWKSNDLIFIGENGW